MIRLDFIANGENLITSNGLQYRVVGERPVDVESFEINFYQTDSDPRTLDKNLKWEMKLKGSLRSGTSIINPVITIESTIAFFQRNYAYIPMFQRYYFVTDVRSVRKNLWEISLRCDVLMTYKEGILSINTRVLRSESNHNWDYTDTLVPARSGASVRSYEGKFITGSLNYPAPNIAISAGTQIEAYGHLLFKVACSKLNHGSSFSTPAFGYVWGTATISGFKEFLDEIYNSGYFAGDYKISDVITDLKWIPTPIPPTKGAYRFVQEIVFENEQTMYNSVYVGKMNQYKFRIGSDILTGKEEITWQISNISLDGKNYKNRPPFRELAVLFSPFGMMKLDSSIWGNKSTLNFRAEVDSCTGDANFYIYDGNYKELLSSANLAIPIDMTYIARDGRTIANAIISGSTAIVSSAISGFTSPAKISKKVNRGIDGALGTLPDAITNTFIVPEFNHISGTGQANALAVNKPILLIHQLNQDDPNLKTQGWLYNTTATLSNLHGYCLVDEGVHVEALLKQGLATKPEIDEIEQLLTSGVILPYDVSS